MDQEHILTALPTLARARLLKHLMNGALQLEEPLDYFKIGFYFTPLTPQFSFRS